jgi:plastocyanin
MSGAGTRIGLSVLCLCMVACGGGDAREQADAPVAANSDPVIAAYGVTEVAEGGVIRGSIRFDGAVPDGRLVQVADDAAECGATQRVQPLVVAPDGGLADVVVSLVDVRAGKPFEIDGPPELDQRGCRFHPHVVLVPAGTPVRVLNGDGVTHNVHTAAFENRPVNRSQAPGQAAIELSFALAEKVRVKCDLHPWMSAWIVVMDHPYHAVTDATGTFTLSSVPPGDYVLETWHEELGTSRRPVTVSAGETTELTIELASDD